MKDMQENEKAIPAPVHPIIWRSDDRPKHGQRCLVTFRGRIGNFIEIAEYRKDKRKSDGEVWILRGGFRMKCAFVAWHPLPAPSR